MTRHKAKITLTEFFLEALKKARRNPEQEKEILYFFLIDLALKSKKLSEQKAWKTLAVLVSLIWKDKCFPTDPQIAEAKASVNRSSRNKESRTSGALYSIEDFEMGEAAMKKFFNSQAWKGMPGFEEDGTPLK